MDISKQQSIPVISRQSVSATEEETYASNKLHSKQDDKKQYYIKFLQKFSQIYVPLSLFIFTIMILIFFVFKSQFDNKLTRDHDLHKDLLKQIYISFDLVMQSISHDTTYLNGKFPHILKTGTFDKQFAISSIKTFAESRESFVFVNYSQTFCKSYFERIKVRGFPHIKNSDFTENRTSTQTTYQKEGYNNPQNGISKYCAKIGFDGYSLYKIYSKIIERNDQESEFYILELDGSSAFSFYDTYAKKYHDIYLEINKTQHQTENHTSDKNEVKSLNYNNWVICYMRYSDSDPHDTNDIQYWVIVQSDISSTKKLQKIAQGCIFGIGFGLIIVLFIAVYIFTIYFLHSKKEEKELEYLVLGNRTDSDAQEQNVSAIEKLEDVKIDYSLSESYQNITDILNDKLGLEFFSKYVTKQLAPELVLFQRDSLKLHNDIKQMCQYVTDKQLYDVKFLSSKVKASFSGIDLNLIQNIKDAIDPGKITGLGEAVTEVEKLLQFNYFTSFKQSVQFEGLLKAKTIENVGKSD